MWSWKRCYTVDTKGYTSGAVFRTDRVKHDVGRWRAGHPNGVSLTALGLGRRPGITGSVSAGAEPNLPGGR